MRYLLSLLEPTRLSKDNFFVSPNENFGKILRGCFKNNGKQKAHKINS
jgi:hypothetical protein